MLYFSVATILQICVRPGAVIDDLSMVKRDNESLKHPVHFVCPCPVENLETAKKLNILKNVSDQIGDPIKDKSETHFPSKLSFHTKKV